MYATIYTIFVLTRPILAYTGQPCTRGHHSTAGAGAHLTILGTSVGKHCSFTRPHSFASPARSHSRHEHETKPKPLSRLGSIASIISPNLQLIGWGELLQQWSEQTIIVKICYFKLYARTNGIHAQLIFFTKRLANKHSSR